MTRGAAGILLLGIFLPLALALAAGAATGEEGGLSVYTLVLFMHQLLFVYWLGPDMGVYYLSGRITDPALSDGQRLAAAQTFVQIDLFPRICMSLMLTVGGLLAHLLGIAHPPWQFAAIILLGPVWLTLVLLQHFRHGAPWMPALVRFDRLLRWGVIAAIIVSVLHSQLTGRLAAAPWLGAKLLGFAFLVFCGLMIRRYFGGYGAGYVALLEREPTAEENAAMQASLGQMRPWVLAIWAVLIVEAWLGVSKPGLGLAG